MKAIILAAGRGSRMHEGTKDIPKCMMNICGKNLLTRCIDAIKKAGIKENDIAIVTGYKDEVIKQSINGVTFFHNNEWAQTNMVYSLTMAESWLKQYDCCVFYSDIIFSPECVKRTLCTNGDIVIPYYTNYLELWSKRFDNPLEDLETFIVNDNDMLCDIGSKPKSYDQINGQYMGIVKFTPNGWNQFIGSVNKTTKPLDKIDMTTLLRGTIESNVPIKCVKCTEMWLECDNLNDIAIYEKEYAANL